MPGALTTGFCNAEVKPFGPVQAKVTPAGVPVPVKLTVVCVQVIIPPPPAAAVGLEVSATTKAVALLKQVVNVSVTVNR